MFWQVVEKALWTRVPSPKTIPTITAAMAATMRPYSTADAPRSRSPRMTSRMYLSIGMRIPSWVWAGGSPPEPLPRCHGWSHRVPGVGPNPANVVWGDIVRTVDGSGHDRPSWHSSTPAQAHRSFDREPRRNTSNATEGARHGPQRPSEGAQNSEDAQEGAEGAGGWWEALRGRGRSGVTLLLVLDQAEPHGRHHGLGPVAGAELLVDVRHVGLGGRLADEQPAGDLGDGQAVDQELEDLASPAGTASARRGRASAAAWRPRGPGR